MASEPSELSDIKIVRRWRAAESVDTVDPQINQEIPRAH